MVADFLPKIARKSINLLYQSRTFQSPHLEWMNLLTVYVNLVVDDNFGFVNGEQPTNVDTLPLSAVNSI